MPRSSFGWRMVRIFLSVLIWAVFCIQKIEIGLWYFFRSRYCAAYPSFHQRTLLSHCVTQITLVLTLLGRPRPWCLIHLNVPPPPVLPNELSRCSESRHRDNSIRPSRPYLRPLLKIRPSAGLPCMHTLPKYKWLLFTVSGDNKKPWLTFSETTRTWAFSETFSSRDILVELCQLVR